MSDMAKRTAEAADRVASALKEHVPGDVHDLLGDFALVRNWAEQAARRYDDDRAEMSLRPRLGETAEETLDRVLTRARLRRGDQ